MYIRRPGVLPVITMHLAALHIQKLFRGRRARGIVRQMKTNNAPTNVPSTSTSNTNVPVNDSKDEKKSLLSLDSVAPTMVKTARLRKVMYPHLPFKSYYLLFTG
jgi:hypothetical protein